MFKAVATEIPRMHHDQRRWLVELGPSPDERYYGSAPDEETAIARAKEEHSRRQSEAAQ